MIQPLSALFNTLTFGGVVIQMRCMLFALVIPFHASSREVDGHMFNLFLTPNKANIYIFFSFAAAEEWDSRSY